MGRGGHKKRTQASEKRKYLGYEVILVDYNGHLHLNYIMHFKFNAAPRTEHLELHVSNFRNLLKWKVTVFTYLPVCKIPEI
jgi:hypothetical protein